MGFTSSSFIVLHCLMFSVLKTVISYLLSAFLVFFSGERVNPVLNTPVLDTPVIDLSQKQKYSEHSFFANSMGKLKCPQNHRHYYGLVSKT